jgi:hypothetical protein
MCGRVPSTLRRWRIELVLEATDGRGRGMECRVVAVPMAADGGDGPSGAILLMEEVAAPALS